MKNLLVMMCTVCLLSGCLEDEPKAETDKPTATVDVNVNINNTPNKEEQPSSRERLRDVYAQ